MYLKKELYELLKTDESIFDFIQNNSLDGLWYWDLENTENEWMNAKFWTVLGYDPDEMPHKSSAWQNLINKDDLQLANENFVKHCEDPNYPYDQIVRYTHKNGSTVWIRCRGKVIFDDKGNPKRMLGAHQDVTDIKRNQNELFLAKEKAEESETQFRLLFDNMEQGFALHEMLYDNENKPFDYRFLLINRSFEKLTGIDASLCLNKTVKDILPKTEKIWIDNFGKVAQTGVSLHFENYSENLGKYYDVIAYSPKKDFFAVVFTDVTKSKLIEKELVKSKEKAEESDRLKSAFLANMSHEIRTPMNGILGFSELLKNQALSVEKQQTYIDIIEKSGKRMLNIINDIIDISKIESGLMKIDVDETNINDQIEYVYNFFKPEADAKNLKLSYKNALLKENAVINSDREKIYAILTNLVKNALKYSENGSIEIGYDIEEVDGIKTLKFYVKDNGIGISKERQASVFDRFIRADFSDKIVRQGAGLGLAISKAYVEMLGGKIWVESKVGVGSTFYFTLLCTSEFNNEFIVWHDSLSVLRN